MAKLRTKLTQFFYKHRNKGVHNLMLYIGIANVIVYVLYLIRPENPLFTNLLAFDPYAAAQGELWRLLSYPLVYLATAGSIFGILSLLFYYWCGLVLEQLWGTLRMNLYYLAGVLLTSLAGLLTRSYATATYVNLSLFLAIATIQPDEVIRIYFVLPIKMKWMAWVDLGFTLIGVIRGLILMVGSLGSGSPYLGWIVPLMPLVVWLLFFGKQTANLLPEFIRYHPTRKSWKRKIKQGQIYDIPNKQGQARFRCTVCGRTELTNPGLEFRYCSKCAGYRCYCEDHIHNHTHITE